MKECKNYKSMKEMIEKHGVVIKINDENGNELEQLEEADIGTRTMKQVADFYKDYCSEQAEVIIYAPVYRHFKKVTVENITEELI